MIQRRLASITAILALMLGLMPWLGTSVANESTTMSNYIVRLKQQATTADLAKISNLAQRRWALYTRLRETADKTQGQLRDVLYKEQSLGRVTSITPLWIDNAIAFRGTGAVASMVQNRAEVDRVTVDEIVSTESTAGTQTAVWNLVKVKTQEVWDQGFSGQGITVGSIDTGVDFSHPALEPKFRGAPAPGENRFHHNWFDFAGTSRYPIDLNGHGTHVMGTIVGGNGPAPDQPGHPDIGLAYNAKWIAARAFGADGKSSTSQVLLASQWMQAPTDLNGLNARPDLAPDVINNSWGSDTGIVCRPWYRYTIKNWRLANIFPVFSIGDGAVHSPGDMGRSSLNDLEQSGSYAVGSTDSSDKATSPEVQWKQGEGCPDQVVGEIRPNVLAPGVDIYSSIPKGSNSNDPVYASKTGTSMAAPHVAGAAALMLEAAGGKGSINTNNYRLDDQIDATADPVATNCAFRCRRLNALAAVMQVRQDGVLQGTITWNDGGIVKGLAGAKISAIPSTTGGVARETYSDAAGNYSIHKLEGTYDVEVRGPIVVTATGEVIGWQRQKITGVVIGPKDTVTKNFLMVKAQNKALEGDVLRYASGDKVAGIRVALDGTPLVSTTDSNGHYRFSSVPDISNPDPAAGDPTIDYELIADPDRCAESKRQSVVMTTNPTLIDVVRPLKRDGGYRYHCVEKKIDWVAGTTPVQLRGDDVSTSVPLPFEFPFYGATRSSAHISSNGFVRFDRASSEFDNTSIPSAEAPNAAAYVFWDDLAMDDKSKILTTTTPDSFVIEWRDMTFAPLYQTRITFSLTLHRNGDMEYQYLSADAQPNSLGNSATIGVEDADGEVALQYSRSEQIVRSGTSILFSPHAQVGERRGVVRGSDGSVVARATVKATDSTGLTRTLHSDANGQYRAWLKADTYSLAVSAFHYDPATVAGVTVTNGNLPDCFPSSRCPVDVQLTRQPGYTVSGTLTDSATAKPIAGAYVTLGNENIPSVLTNSTGGYVFFDVPSGTYQLGTAGSGRCIKISSRAITVSGANTVQDLSAATVRDSYGYVCRDAEPLSTAHDSAASTPVALNADDGAAEVALPFTFPLYGHPALKAYVSSNGFVRFDKASAQYENTVIPSAAEPNFALFPFWDDLAMDTQSRVSTKTDGATYFAIEWVNMVPLASPDSRMHFEVILHPSGAVEYQYRAANPDTFANGTSASVGMEDRGGLRGFKYSVNEAAISTGLRVRFFVPGSEGGGGGETDPPTGTGIIGFVRNASNGAPLGGVRVTVCGGCVTGTAITDASGGYGLTLPAGTYTATASLTGYVSQSKTATVGTTGLTNVDFGLGAAAPVGIAGVVLDQSGRVVPGIEIGIRDLSKPSAPASSIYTDAAGAYGLALPPADYELTFPGGCVLSSQPATPFRLSVSGTTRQNFVVNLLEDSFGYTCVNRLGMFVPGTVPILLPGPGTELVPSVLGVPPVYSPRVLDIGDDSMVPVALPFDFPFYGKNRKIAFISTDGYIRLDNGLADLNGPVINVLRVPDFVVDGAEIVVGPAHSDAFAIEWRGVRLGDTAVRVTFQVLLHKGGDVNFVYKLNSEIAAPLAKVGVEDGCGGAALVYSDKVAGRIKVDGGIHIRPPGAQKLSYRLC